MGIVDGSGSLPGSEGLPSWTYELAEERLVEAMACWRRAPDRERGWLHVEAIWPEITREWAAGDYDGRGYLGTSSDVPLRPLPLARAEVARMEEASEWIGRYVERDEDRTLVALALGYKASGRRPPWRKIKHRLGIPFGEDGLRRRYERAIGAIAKGLAETGCLTGGAR